jgi:hypothetical protein
MKSYLSKAGRGDAEIASDEARPDTRRLDDYWAHGDGAAQIGWDTPGDFDRCRAQLGKYIHDPEVLAGHCSNLHEMATGARPGHGPAEQAMSGKGNEAELQKDWDAWDDAHGDQHGKLRFKTDAKGNTRLKGSGKKGKKVKPLKQMPHTHTGYEGAHLPGYDQMAVLLGAGRKALESLIVKDNS